MVRILRRNYSLMNDEQSIPDFGEAEASHEETRYPELHDEGQTESVVGTGTEVVDLEYLMLSRRFKLLDQELLQNMNEETPPAPAWADQSTPARRDALARTHNGPMPDQEMAAAPMPDPGFDAAPASARPVESIRAAAAQQSTTHAGGFPPQETVVDQGRGNVVGEEADAARAADFDGIRATTAGHRSKDGTTARADGADRSDSQAQEPSILERSVQRTRNLPRPPEQK